MKFKIKRNILLENLTHVSKAISPRNLIPILTGIKFDLTEEGLYLSASDTDISVQCLIDRDKISEISEYGSIVIGGKYIVEIIRKLPDTDIMIEVLDGFKMIISTSNTEFNLNGINPADFPNLDLTLTEKPIILNTEVFKNLVNQTFFATSQNEARPLLTGINFRIKDGNLEVMATDSYRLSRKVIVLDDVVSSELNIVIPGKNLVELTKMIGDENNNNIELHIFNNKILFKYKNILFLSRLLSGTYPATSSIIPKDFNISVDCNANVLYEMIDRASLLTSDRDKNTIKLELVNKEMIISSNSPEIGKVEEKMAVDSDDAISISFSSKYMLDCIKSFGTSNITLYMNSDSAPIIVKSIDDESLVELVLPIKTY